MPAEDLRDSAASCGEEETMNTKQSAICSTKSAPRRASPHRAAARDRRLSFESQPEEATSADTAATNRTSVDSLSSTTVRGGIIDDKLHHV